MLSKRRPFETAGTALATVLVRRREPPRPLHEVVPGVPAAWEAAIHRCLERDPARRFASAGEVIAAIEDESARGPGRLRTALGLDSSVGSPVSCASDARSPRACVAENARTHRTRVEIRRRPDRRAATACCTSR